MKKTQHMGAKSEKSRAQKDAHNQHCKQYRQRVKRRREDLEHVESKYNDLLLDFQNLVTETRMKNLEIEACKSKIRDMENYIQRVRPILEEKNRNKKRMRQNPIEYKGQIFNSSDELAEWILSQKYVHDDQAPLGSLDGFGSETGNLPLYMADFYQQMGFGQDYTNTASAAYHVGSSSATGARINSAANLLDGNHDWSEFDFTNQHDNIFSNDLAAGARINSVADLYGNHDWSEFDFTNQHDNIFNNDLAAGVPVHSAAVPSLGPNSEVPIAPDAKNNHGNADDLFTLDPDADLGFQ